MGKNNIILWTTKEGLGRTLFVCKGCSYICMYRVLNKNNYAECHICQSGKMGCNFCNYRINANGKN